VPKNPLGPKETDSFDARQPEIKISRKVLRGYIDVPRWISLHRPGR
jgi:hypothetical protein